MTEYRVSEAPTVLLTSTDTVRRLMDADRLPSRTDDSGRMIIPGRDLAAYLKAQPKASGDTLPISARNRLTGVVTDVRVDGVMGQVQLRCGPQATTVIIESEAGKE